MNDKKDKTKDFIITRNEKIRNISLSILYSSILYYKTILFKIRYK